MNTQENTESFNQSRLILHRIYVKSSTFESFSVSMASLQQAVQPSLEMQIFANAYARDNNTHQTVLGLKISAKHNGELICKIDLEEAGFYTLEGFSEAQQQDILNGCCMKLYSHAAAVVTQLVTQGGFLPIYLQPMDFNKIYQEQKKTSVPSAQAEAFSKRLNDVMLVSEQSIN